MIKREIIFFEKPGADNTQATFEAIRERVKLLGSVLRWLKSFQRRDIYRLNLLTRIDTLLVEMMRLSTTGKEAEFYGKIQK